MAPKRIAVQSGRGAIMGGAWLCSWACGGAFACPMLTETCRSLSFHQPCAAPVNAMDAAAPTSTLAAAFVDTMDAAALAVLFTRRILLG